MLDWECDSLAGAERLRRGLQIPRYSHYPLDVHYSCQLLSRYVRTIHRRAGTSRLWAPRRQVPPVRLPTDCALSSLLPFSTDLQIYGWVAPAARAASGPCVARWLLPQSQSSGSPPAANRGRAIRQEWQASTCSVDNRTAPVLSWSVIKTINTKKRTGASLRYS